MRRLSVKASITLWFSALTLLVTAAALGFIIEMGGSMLSSTAQERLARAVNRNSEYVEYKESERYVAFELDEEFEPFSMGSYSLVYTRAGKLLSGAEPDGFIPTPLTEGPPRLVEGVSGDFYVYDRYADGGRIWVRGIMPASEQNDFHEMMVQLAFFLLPALVAAASLGCYLIVRRAFRPMDRMIAAADAIGEGRDLSLRIGLPKRDDEIHKIAAAFDGMLARLEGSFEAEKQFASDASHELRTPTAVILAQCAALDKAGLSERDYKNGVAAIERQAQKMSRLINLLLNITRFEQGTAKPSFERADLSELAEVVCREMSSVRDDVELSREIEPDIYAEIDVPLMSRLIENLIENAFKYGGGKVHVKLARDGEDITLSVGDNGPGIPPEELPKIWQRFYRADKSRSSGGLGLGLSLVKQIASLHGARIEAESFIGRGSVFTLTMPAK